MRHHTIIGDPSPNREHPNLQQAPWQRPTNENGNCLVRRYVGKSTDLALYSPDDLRAIEHRINTIPRRSLGWETAHDR